MMPSRTNWLLITLLLCAGLFSAAQFGKFTLTLDLLGAVYGDMAAPMISIVGIVGIAFGAVAGAMVTRIGMARALIAAILLGGALSLIEALLPPTPVMIALRVAEGVSHLAMVVAAPTLMAAHASDRDRPVVMGIWASFFGISLALTALVLPSLLALGGLQAVLIAHGVGLLAMGAALWPVLPKERLTRSEPVSYFAEHKAIYTTPNLLIAGGGFVFYTILYIALLAVLPGLLDLPLWSLSIPPMISLIGTFAAGFMARTVAPDRIAIAGFVLTIMSMTALWLTGTPITAWTLIAIATLFATMGLIPGACFAMIPHFNPELRDRARATGGIAQMGNIGTTTGTPIFVAVTNAWGLGGVTLALAVFCALGIATLAVLRAKMK